MIARYVFIAFLIALALIVVLYVDCRASGFDFAYCRVHLSPAVDRLERLADPDK